MPQGAARRCRSGGNCRAGRNVVVSQLMRSRCIVDRVGDSKFSNRYTGFFLGRSTEVPRVFRGDPIYRRALGETRGVNTGTHRQARRQGQRPFGIVTISDSMTSSSATGTLCSKSLSGDFIQSVYFSDTIREPHVDGNCYSSEDWYTNIHRSV